ncbi:FG-GAP repeat protein [Mycetohabitans sp. B2]|uniref:FG-GAP repeat protein n=1 Tax=Mycetohabitans sp. B2 TaxID=2841274 RepID=UPI001F47C3A0|nr:FG-GAP repeat protein [Mycetohabitans sp. B2]MCF7695940.1 FG-GAP repeat protein [Mycetohabitans sp. B2]
MTTPRKTGRNLLKNGTFEKNFLDPGNGWESANPDEPGVAQEKDFGTGLNYLYFERGIVQQRFALPVNPGKLDATNYGYQLSFQYQPTRFQGGEEPYAELRAWPSEEKDRVELPTAGSDNRLAADDYTQWLSREVFFKSYKDHDIEFEVRLASGRNPEVSLSVPEHEPPEATPLAVEWPFREGELHVAGSSTDASAHPGVAVQLHLPPLTLQDGKVHIHFEGNTHIAPLLPDGRVPICRGATHVMTLLPEEDNGWAGDGPYPGTDVYGEWDNTDEAERLKVTLSATASKPEDDAQHVTAPWRIECGNAASGEIDITIDSVYHAESFALPCAVGHYQLAISEHPEPSHWPVIPLNETVRLAVQVCNGVAKVHADNVVVQWEAPKGPNLCTTDEAGWAYFTYQPTADKTPVEASVNAPYNIEPDQCTFTVRAIPTLPWVQFEVYLDEQPISEQPINLNALDLSPGSKHVLLFKPSPQSVLEGQSFYLAWGDNSSNPEDLGVSFDPLLGQERELTTDGICWTISCTEEASGRFELQLCTSRLRCPLSLDCWIADHYKIEAVDQQDVIPVLAWNETIKVKVQIFSLHTDRAVSGAEVKWEDNQIPPKEYKIGTGPDGWAEWTYQPSVASPHQLIATIAQPREQEPLKHCFDIEVLDKFDWSLFEVTLDNEPVELATIDALDLYPGSDHVLVIKLSTQSILEGQPFHLAWGDNSFSPSEMGVSFSPALEQPLQLTKEGIRWTISCTEEANGRFNFQLRTPRLRCPLDMNGWIADSYQVENTHQEDIIPVLAEDDTVTVKVQIYSHHTAKPVEGIVVQWQDNHTPPTKHDDKTDKDGWVMWVYSPSVAGSRRVTATVDQPREDSPLEQYFNIEVLDKFEWSLFEVMLDDNPVRLDEGMLLSLRADTAHTLRITSKSSVIVGNKIALNWLDEPNPGITFFPILGQSETLPEDGLTWEITCDENSVGVTDLVFSCDRIPCHPLEFSAEVTKKFAREFQLTASDKAQGDYFGESVAISGDGQTVVVGAYFSDPDGLRYAGAAYVFTREGDKWTEQKKLTASDKAEDDYFGHSVAISDDGQTVVVGAYRSGPYAGGSKRAGAAYVFTREGDKWTEQKKLTAKDKETSEYLGYSVAISGNGQTVVAGAFWNDPDGLTNAGAAYVFIQEDGKWTEQEILTASDKAKEDQFGYSVAISGDGQTVVAGARYSKSNRVSAGAVYVFVRESSGWMQQEKLTASDKAQGDYFGESVAISGDGQTVVVGALVSDPDGLTDAGAAYVFTREGGKWTEQKKMTALDKAEDYMFGISVAISGDGQTVVVGAHKSGSDNEVVVGAAYMFHQVDSEWEQSQKLTTLDKVMSDQFGHSVAVSGDGEIVVVGAYRSDVDNVTGAGAAYTYI